MKSALASAVVLSIVVLLVSHAAQPAKTGPETEKRFPPLKVPFGFKATLFACDPLIEYPSVIAAGPKPGAIFVAIDYMTGLGTDGKVKSEIRLIEDTDSDGYADKSTTVAQGFNSIQGLAFHDGTLFVMHAPFLTSVNWKTKERKDLLSGLGLKPEDNSSRLHCANGVVLGHDGWLYLAVGDNGIDVPRPEGDRLVYHGGGILRCRLDGRDLHVFSTGLRNIYDIALDADLNVFTRDNENDGGTYMIRVCHAFHGSDHGYPYDYAERPDHAMKPIGDFGLGSSAGGVCYLETQFPKAYRGNLFFCEWGKSVVRYEPKRSGSGFAPVKELEFITGDPKDTYPFKPTDIVVQRDGTLMVSDYADGQRPKRGRGRIYHIKYVGQDADPVKKPKTDLDRLNSESYFERWEAQIAFERRGDAGRNDLGNAFRNNELSQLGFGHALQVFSKGTGGSGLGDMLVMSHSGDGPVIRALAVRKIGDLTDPILVKHKLDAGRGDVEIAKTLATLEKRDDPRLILEIVIALGRLRWADAPDWLTKNITKPDDTLAHAAMQTLRRADNWPAVLKVLDQADNVPMRTIALRAVSDRYENVVVDGLIDRLGATKDAEQRRQFAELLTRVYKKPGAWKYWGYRPGPRPVNTESWERTDAIEKALDNVLADADFAKRDAVLKHMQREKVPIRQETLGIWLIGETRPAAAAVILAAITPEPPETVRESLMAVVANAKHSAANRKLAFQILRNDPKADVVKMLRQQAQSLEDGPVLAFVLSTLYQYPNAGFDKILATKLKSPSAEVRAAAMESLGELCSPLAKPALLPLLQDEDVRVRRATTRAAGQLQEKSTTEALLKLGSDPDTETRRACLIALNRLEEPRVVPLAVTALNNPELTGTALMSLSLSGDHKQAAAVIDVAKRYPRFIEVGLALDALSTFGRRAKSKSIEEQMNRAVAEIQGTHGMLLHWRVVGPLTAEEKSKIIKDYVALAKTPENARLKTADSAEGRLQLSDKGVKGLHWLAFTDVQMPNDAAVEFLGSSYGSFEVWLNGASIHRRQKDGKYDVDSDRFPGALKKGANRLVVETNEPRFAEFHLRFRRKSSKAEHEKLIQAALSRPGNAERGRKVFFDKEKSQCIKCHRMDDQGERIGPDLTGVGARFARIHIIESILEPSRTIAPSYGTYAVALKNGKTLSGVKLGETETMVTIADNQGVKHDLVKREIEEMNLSAVSTMPDGLEGRLTIDEFVDLIGFLMSQKEKR